MRSDVGQPANRGVSPRKSAPRGDDEWVRSLRVRLLGSLEVEGCDPTTLGRRQVRTLLKVLALAHGRPVPVDRLVDCLWGSDDPPPRAASQVSVLASRLRAVVGSERLQRGDAGYVLTVDWLDVDALEEYAVEAERRLAAGSVAAARAAAAAGLSLLRGPLLADEPDASWADTERHVIDRCRSRLLQTAAGAALAGADWAGVIELAHRMLEADPMDEAGLRLLMEAQSRSGRPAAALAAYASMRERLADELGASPAPLTDRLHLAILRAEPHVAATTAAPPAFDHSALPGRAAAIRQLDSMCVAAISGHASVAVVEGEAGIGKSLLLQVWSAHIAARARVLTVCCNELGRQLPLQPLLDVVAALVRDSPTSGADVLGPDIAVLGPLVGMTSMPVHPAQLTALTDPAAGRVLVFAALFNVLRHQAETAPLVLAIDDLHLADDATLAWVGQASSRLAGARVMVVGTRRIEEAVPLPGVSTVVLSPLAVEHVAVIVGEARAPELHARSGGHPLFLVELAAVGPDAELPATIRQAVDERCARAGDAGTTLRSAAVLGPEIDLDVLAAATGAPASLLIDHLEEGVRRRLLVETGATFVFAHALVREALLATVGASRRALLHREAAHVLSGRPGADPLAVARHARLGGEVSLASALLVDAAGIAVSRFHQMDALGLLDEAIGLDDSARARLERARVHSMLARYEAATADLEVASALGAGPEALEVAAWSAHYQRRFDEALVAADRGARDSLDPDVRASCLALGGWVSLSAGDLSGAEERLVHAVEAAPPAGSRLAETWLGWLRATQSRQDEALGLLHSTRGSGLASYRFPNAYAQMAATMALATLGRVDEALAALDILSLDVTRMGALRWTARPSNLRGWIVRNLGSLTEADELNHAAIESAEPLGLTEPLANALLDLASGRLMVGDPDGARALLDDADRLGDAPHAFRWRHQLRARLLRGRLGLAVGELERARTIADGLAEDAAVLGLPRYEVQARLVAAQAVAGTSDAPDLDSVGRLLTRLGVVAGLESWWITADVAHAYGVEAWLALAERRVGALLQVAGPYASSLELRAGQLV